MSVVFGGDMSCILDVCGCGNSDTVILVWFCMVVLVTVMVVTVASLCVCGGVFSIFTYIKVISQRRDSCISGVDSFPNITSAPRQ